MREVVPLEPDRLGVPFGPHAATPATAGTWPLLTLIVRASVAQGLVLYLFCVAPVLRPEMMALALVLVVTFLSEAWLRAAGKGSEAALLAIVSINFASAYAVYLTGSMRSPFFSWAAFAGIASIFFFRHAWPKLAMACGATALGLAAAYVLRPSPPEMAPGAAIIVLLVCPLGASAYLLAGFLLGRWGKGRRSSGQDAEQARLEQLADDAEAADKRITRFLTEANYAIRTPLNAIIGYSEMILEDGSDAFSAENLADVQRIQQATGQLLKLVSDVFDLSEIERRQKSEEIAH